MSNTKQWHTYHILRNVYSRQEKQYSTILCKVKQKKGKQGFVIVNRYDFKNNYIAGIKRTNPPPYIENKHNLAGKIDFVSANGKQGFSTVTYLESRGHS